MPAVTIAAVAAVAVGAATQRVTGLGFALLSAPFLVLILGPHEGVLVANALGALTSAMILSRGWSQVDWPRVRQLLPASLVAVPLSAEAALKLVLALALLGSLTAAVRGVTGLL